MRLRAVFEVALLGILAAFCVWSVIWTIDGREQRTYGMGTEVASFTARLDAGQFEDKSITSDIMAILDRSGEALIIDTNGEGAPGLWLLDPGGRSGIASRIDSQNAPGMRAHALLFEGSYCERSFETSGTCPLVPNGFSVAGTVPPPPGVTTNQYFLVPGATDRLPGGTYILSGSDRLLLGEVQTILTAGGAELGDVIAPPLAEELRNSPLLALSLLLYGIGALALTAWWRTLADARVRSLYIHRMFGATSRILLEKSVLALLPGIFCGGGIGVIASYGLVWAASGLRPGGYLLPWLVVAWVVNSAVAGVGAVIAWLFPISRSGRES